MLSNRFFPYSSMQEINLDWILTKIKNILRFVPDDGAVGQILRRTAHGAEWSDEQGGGGGAVSSVNGQTGAVVLTASDVGALPETYAAPVDSVNGQTGTVVLPIPSDTSELTNGAGYVDAAGAAAAAPVQSVNSQTGAVVLSIPSDTADLTNTAGFVDAAGAAAAAPVQSVNGQTGAVTISPTATSESMGSGATLLRMGNLRILVLVSYQGGNGGITLSSSDFPVTNVRTAGTRTDGNGRYLSLCLLGVNTDGSFLALYATTYAPSSLTAATASDAISGSIFWNV